MKNKHLIKKALAYTGQFVSMVWNSPMKTRAGVASDVRKEVSAVVRVGLAQDSRAAVIEARRRGNLPAKNAGLRWGRWIFFPYLIEHKTNIYLRVYPVAGHNPNVKYFLNGVEARLEEIQELVYASELPKEYEAWNCFFLNVENLVAIK